MGLIALLNFSAGKKEGNMEEQFRKSVESFIRTEAAAFKSHVIIWSNWPTA